MDFEHLASLLAVDELVERIERVEQRLSEALLLDGVGLGPPASRMALSGGKRLRPVMVIAAAHIFDVFDDRVVSGAAAVELVQVGSLVHDDIFDNASTRRGVPTINATDGDEPAILAGDYILARAGVEASRVSAEAARVLAGTVIELCIGQHQETVQLDDRQRTIEQHFSSIEAKTAALFDVSARMGGLAADAPVELVDAIGTYARAFGMSFQIVDDVLDLVADPARLGKPVGSDLRAGVYTLPVLHAMSGDRGEELCRMLDGPVDNDVSAVASRIVAESGGIEQALAAALEFERTAVSALDSFDGHPTVAGFRELPEQYRIWALSTLGDNLAVGPADT
ncbi:MAG: polyprenyl synthetase family protein [Actinomycetia bacterium]|nr:polyprenyl synthetase family protein [Actinomycetes bacterium]